MGVIVSAIVTSILQGDTKWRLGLPDISLAQVKERQDSNDTNQFSVFHHPKASFSQLHLLIRYPFLISLNLSNNSITSLDPLLELRYLSYLDVRFVFLLPLCRPVRLTSFIQHHTATTSCMNFQKALRHGLTWLISYSMTTTLQFSPCPLLTWLASRFTTSCSAMQCCPSTLPYLIFHFLAMPIW